MSRLLVIGPVHSSCSPALSHTCSSTAYAIEHFANMQLKKSFAAGAGSFKDSNKQVPSSSDMQNGMDHVAWGHTHLGPASLLNSAGSGMNAAAAALNDCTSDNILNDIMGDDNLLDSGLDPHLLLTGDGDPTDASFLAG